MGAITRIGEEEDLGVRDSQRFGGRFWGFEKFRVCDDVFRLGRLDGMFQFIGGVAGIGTEEETTSANDALDEDWVEELSRGQRLGLAAGTSRHTLLNE